ncbi:MAG TPA: hypothetical protein VII12_11495 [Thermoanaerobaculia bacterium]
MKKTFLAALCVISFVLLSGEAVLQERPNPVTINGKPFANAYNIKGVIAISVADLAKAFNGSPNLQQAGFQLQGNTLATMGNFEAVVSPRDPASGLPTGKRMHKPFVITKQIDVSSAVIMKDGKAFVPLSDVIKAFGGVYNVIQGNLRGSQTLNFNVNGGAFAVGQ